jgi:glycosyltransferase involved in cell wall biosynthesis
LFSPKSVIIIWISGHGLDIIRFTYDCPIFERENMNFEKSLESSNHIIPGPTDENENFSPEISVVICVKNGAKTIEQLFRSLKDPSIKEVVIVDGVSNDGTLDICRKYSDKIISDEGKGLAHARQIGAEAATGDIIVYIDADVEIPSPEIFQKMYDEMTNNGWVAINPQMLDPRVRKNIWEEAQDIYYRRTFNFVGEKRYLIGMVLMIRRDIVLKYPFDPVFTFGSEDTDFIHRLGEKGHKFGVSTKTAFHFHRSSLKDFARQKIGYGQGDMNFIMKHRTYKNLTTPAYILLTGFFRSIRVRKPSHIFFYFLWAFFLEIGMLKGLLFYFRNKSK